MTKPPPPFKLVGPGDIECGCCGAHVYAFDGAVSAYFIIRRHLEYFEDGDSMVVVQCHCGAEYARFKQPDPLRNWLAPVRFTVTA